jgi:alpha-ribazole phosphatase
VMHWFDDTCARSNTSVHVVTHAGVIRVLTARLLDAKQASVLQWPLDHGAIVWLKRVRDEWLLVRWNA